MSTMQWLDDSDWSIDPEDEPTRLWVPITVLIVTFLLWFAVREFDRWTTPPPIIIGTPSVPQVGNFTWHSGRNYDQTITCISSGDSTIYGPREFFGRGSGQ